MSWVQVPPPLFFLMKYIYPSFLENIKKFNLIEAGDTIIAAFSGGKDSVTQLLLLKELQKDIKFKLIAAYFNHHIREDAQEEEQWVKDFCASRRVELQVGGGDVKAYKKKHGLNLENAASRLRSRFLEESAAGFENAKIATAHTKSDLTETFFIKLLRGSGSRGLSAIYSRIGDNIIRPLLFFPQKDILAFLERNKIHYYRDYTNEQNIFLRNKIRHVLIPEIEKIEPDIDNHIFKTVSMIREEYEYFKELAGRILKQNLIMGKILPIKTLGKKHLALQRHIMREYIRLLKGDLLDIDFKHVENILNNISKSRGTAIPGLELRFNKGYIYPKNLSIPGYHYVVKAAGIQKIEEIEKEIIIAEGGRRPQPKALSNFEIYVSLSAVKFPLTVRSPEKKDKYKKLNSSFSQRVFEMIREAGFPPELRNLCPVVLNGDGKLIWAAGSPPAHAFRLKDREEQQYLELSCR